MDAKFLLNEALIILKICKKTKKNEILIFFLLCSNVYVLLTGQLNIYSINIGPAASSPAELRVVGDALLRIFHK